MDNSKSIIWAILLAVMTLTDTCIAFSKALERSKLDGHDTHDIELYVEHKLHFIHAKIDLQPTITGLVTMDKYISQMDKRMTDTLGSTLSKNLVRRLDKIVKKLKRVITKNQLSTRDRRAIELIGNLISDIFGNPGPADWKQAKANFLALQKKGEKSCFFPFRRTSQIGGDGLARNLVHFLRSKYE